MPTIGCNFCCPYCFEGKKENVSMNEKTIKNIIRFLNDSSAKELSLHWYGGEPLLRFDLMKEIYEG
ncbi:4Fe-4S cluster-binding domain-containing protein, partial [Acinetobacter pittii]|uniref:4Fe-4S cluster-binding domain-containing protein n=1 Tax=Acinetobacter pittii TaxID=48296 RepID=UPI00332EAE8F